MDADARERIIEAIPDTWGHGSSVDELAPSLAGDERFRRWYGRVERMGASPAAAMALRRMNGQIDVRDVVPVIAVPTLVLHRAGDRDSSIEEGRYLASRIPGARFVELAGDDHFPWAGDQDALLDEVEEFLTGVRPGPEHDRVLSTVLFTDIVGSTETVTRLGDQAWRDLVERHHAIVRSLLGRYRGNEVDTAGDGFFATFDGPARAVKCAASIADAVKPLGIQIRAGVHTGEVETVAGKAGGVAVVIGSRIGSIAGPSQVLASQTVKDLTTGSGIAYQDAGEHELKGVPDRWRLYQVVG
jgi:class 3 adenylate cyclase